MERLHEAMEVAALFVLEGQALEKEIHDPGLAATHSAPQVQPPLGSERLLALEQATEEAGAASRGEQPRAKIIESRDRRELRRVDMMAEP
jgi:hypothetical protein